MNFWRTIAYNFLLFMLSPLLLAHTVRQSVARKGGQSFIVQRMGWQINTVTPAASSIWLHAASVGEARAVMPLLDALQKHFHRCHFTLTCNTPEALQILTPCLTEKTTLQYCAIDFPAATRQMFRQIKPSLLILVETELWPNMLSNAAHQQVPVVVINGRLSAKTLKTPDFIQSFYRDALRHVTQVLARSTADAEGYQQLGVQQSKITVLGNLKNAYQKGSRATSLPELNNRRYILAASTHAPEEALFAKLASQSDELPLVVIAPRHPQRSTEIQQILGSFSTAVRSRGEPVTDTTRFYLADTTGELDSLFADAVVVYMGGSLSQTGGHNLLEPAAWGRPIISGPQLWNFTDESELLLRHKGMLVVKDADQLAAALSDLATNPQRCQQLGNAALKAVSEQSRETLDRYLAGIIRHHPQERP